MATTIREDGARLLVLAARVTARLKRPPTLDPEDMIQDAVVALIETLDQFPHRAVPKGYLDSARGSRNAGGVAKSSMPDSEKREKSDGNSVPNPGSLFGYPYRNGCRTTGAG